MGARGLVSVLLAGLVYLFGWSAYAQERVIQFDSFIEVFEDNSLVVTETITIRAEGNIFKRGIVRNFPLTRNLPNATRPIRVGFEILEVKRDGRDEPYHTSSGVHQIDIYVGQEDVFLDFGKEYTYTLKYRTTKQVGFFDDFDELYWNVNGNGWDLVFDRTTATVKLPGDLNQQVLSTAVYTGSYGESESDARMTRTPEGYYRWQTTKALQPYEGLTIALSWPVGVIQRPTAEELAREEFYRQSGYNLMQYGAILIMLYYAFFWFKVGVDPKGGIIFPLFTPPQGLSPAAIRYVRKMAWDNKVFSASILGAAVKGWLTISKEGKTFTLERADSGSTPLSPDEKAGFDKLLGSRSSLEMDQKYHSTFSGAQKAIQKSLDSKHHKVHFHRNTGYIVIGVILSLLVSAGSLFLIAMFADIYPDDMFPMIMLTFAGFFVIPFQVTMIKLFRDAWNAPTWQSILGAVLVSIIVLPIGIGYLVALFWFSWELSQTLFIGLLIIFLANAIFGMLMKAPTKAGRKLLDEIEGFRMFLRATERERLEFLHPPEKTPELFEQYLPYAVALDVENKWADQFSDVFARIQQTENRDYSPSFYRGGYAHFNAASFTNDIGNRMASSLSSASTSPSSSSSGSGGGGSSGGGGGGGGGGGW